MSDAGSQSESGSDRRQLIEVCVFLFLILPSMFLSFFAVRQGNLPFLLIAASTILRDLGLAALIFFFAWRNEESLALLGLRPARSFWAEIGLGLGVFVPFFFAVQLIERLFIAAGLSVPTESNPIAIPDATPLHVAAAILLVVVVAFSEELIFRAYLFHRFRGAGLGVIPAVIVASLIFALGHGYEGTAGVATVGAMGFIFAGLYWWRKSLVVPMTVHFLQDLLLIVVIPLVSRG